MPVHSFQIGNLDCAILSDNSSTSKLRDLFPAVPELEFQKAKTTLNLPEQITVGYNCLYLKQNNQHILVDTGTGQGQLLTSLKEIGLSAEDLDIIILTHGDRDHIGGVLDFPNARFILSQKMFESWSQSEKQEQMVEEFIGLFRRSLDAQELELRAKGRRKFYLEMLPAIQDRLNPVSFEQEFLPGIKLVDATGHRSDHSALEINSQSQTLLHIVDSIRHPLQIKYDWASFIDSYPSELITSNKRLVTRALTSNALIFSSHLTFPGLARLNTSPAGLEWHWLE